MKSVLSGIVPSLPVMPCVDNCPGDTMTVVNVAFYGSDDLAKLLAKKNDSRDT